MTQSLVDKDSMVSKHLNILLITEDTHPSLKVLKSSDSEAYSFQHARRINMSRDSLQCIPPQVLRGFRTCLTKTEATGKASTIPYLCSPLSPSLFAASVG